MKVYSLVAKHGEPRYLQAAQGDYWFWQRGYDVVPFNREQLTKGELDGDLLGDIENTIVYASVAVIHEAIERAGRPAPPYIDFPSELNRYCGRSIRHTTLGNIKQCAQTGPAQLPAHVKPLDRHKLFTGKVVRDLRDLSSLSGIPNEERVIVQEVVTFVSEWRAYVLRGKVLNVAHYKGDPLSFPDTKIISAALDSFSNGPIGYGMDWGVTEDGRTLLVEVKDGFALGNYGIRGHHYTALIEARWRQLMGLADNGIGMDR